MDDIDSLSSGSMSRDLGDLWRQGCLREVVVGSADEDEVEDSAGSADVNEDEGLEDK